MGDIKQRCGRALRLALGWQSLSMNMTGFSSGFYSLQDERKVIIKEGEDIVRLLNGNIAGSVLTMDMAIKNFINHSKCSLRQAIRMASYNPAKITGLLNKKGQIKEGMDADIVIFDDDINIKMTIVEGNIEYNDLLQE